MLLLPPVCIDGELPRALAAAPLHLHKYHSLENDTRNAVLSMKHSTQNQTLQLKLAEKVLMHES